MQPSRHANVTVEDQPPKSTHTYPVPTFVGRNRKAFPAESSVSHRWPRDHINNHHHLHQHQHHQHQLPLLTPGRAASRRPSPPGVKETQPSRRHRRHQSDASTRRPQRRPCRRPRRSLQAPPRPLRRWSSSRGARRWSPRTPAERTPCGHRLHESVREEQGQEKHRVRTRLKRFGGSDDFDEAKRGFRPGVSCCLMFGGGRRQANTRHLVVPQP